MNEPNDNLDALLAQSPPPPAPAWFEQRLRARLYRESAGPAWKRWWHRLGVTGKAVVWTGCVAAFALGVWLSPTLEPASGREWAQEDYFQAFDAFVSYSEQAQAWDVEW
jgi:hypothetical protein